MKHKVCSLLISLISLCVSFGCTSCSTKSNEYLSMKSYMKGYLEKVTDSYGHADHLLFDKNTQVTASYTTYDTAIYYYDENGNFTYQTVSVLPSSYNWTYNEDECYLSSLYPSYTESDGEDVFITLVTTEEETYTSSPSLIEYKDTTTTEKNISYSLEETVTDTSEERETNDYSSRYSSYEEYKEGSLSLFSEVKSNITSLVSNLYSTLFEYQGSYICREEVSLEEGVFSFYFTRQYYEYSWYVMEGTLDTKTGTLSYTYETTYVSDWEGSYNDLGTVVESHVVIERTLSFSDDPFDIPFSI